MLFTFSSSRSKNHTLESGNFVPMCLTSERMPLLTAANIERKPTINESFAQFRKDHRPGFLVGRQLATGVATEDNAAVRQTHE